MEIEVGVHHLDGDKMRHMCSDKCTFRTRQIAKTHLKAANAQRRKQGEKPLRMYRCPVCGYWHFTSTESKGRRKRK